MIWHNGCMEMAFRLYEFLCVSAIYILQKMILNNAHNYMVFHLYEFWYGSLNCLYKIVVWDTACKQIAFLMCEFLGVASSHFLKIGLNTGCIDKFFL